MYTKIHRKFENTGSCIDLVEYLEKENKEKDIGDKAFFFSQDDDIVTEQKVTMDIDSNIKGLKQKESKFFMLSINPTQRELQHIGSIASGGRTIRELSDMSKEEIKRYNEMFRDYIRGCMEDYANNFNRDIESNDILYYGKIEHERKYDRFDPAIKEGNVKAGDKKPGLQTHCHIIVSRKDKSMKKSLSPLANSRGKSENHKLNGESVKVGFDRTGFKEDCENRFDQQFGYNRQLNERFQYMNGQAKGVLNGSEQAVFSVLRMPDNIIAKELKIRPAEAAQKAVKLIKNPLSASIKESLRLAMKIAGKSLEI